MNFQEYIAYKIENKPYQIGVTKTEYIELIHRQEETIEEHFHRISELEEMCNDTDWD